MYPLLNFPLTRSQKCLRHSNATQHEGMIERKSERKGTSFNWLKYLAFANFTKRLQLCKYIAWDSPSVLERSV